MSADRLTVARIVAGAGLLVALSAIDAHAQAATSGSRLEVGGGVRWFGAARFGSADANQTLPEGGSTPLFETDTRLQPGFGFEGRLGLPISPALQIDLSAAWGRSELSTRITSDTEDVPDITVASDITQIALDAAVTLHLAQYGVGASTVPFVSVGFGYLRELHEDRTLVETGRFFHAGGGINVLLSSSPTGVKGIGIRADARAVIRFAGVALDDDPVVLPALGASLFFRF